MLKQVLIGFLYVISMATIALVKILSFPTRNLKRHRIGGITFYGPPDFALTFEKAIYVELAKYDDELCGLIVSKKIKLDFFYFDNLYMFYPEKGVFFVPKWIFEFGSEGVCQQIVFSILSSRFTGLGLRATIRISSKRKTISACRAIMRAWIREKHFPERWLSSYKPKEPYEK